VALLEVLPEVGTLSDGFHFWSCIFTNSWMPRSLSELLPFVHMQNFNKTIGFLAAMGCVVLVIFSALLIGAMRSGSTMMQLQAGVSQNMVDVVQGLIIVFLCAEHVIRYYIKRRTGGKKHA